MQYDANSSHVIILYLQLQREQDTGSTADAEDIPPSGITITPTTEADSLGVGVCGLKFFRLDDLFISRRLRVALEYEHSCIDCT
jgi:hypothetical protein